MGADWYALTRYLNGSGDSVTLSWRELEDVVGGMPQSSIDHQAWWGGDRPHTRAWRAAGYQVATRTPGVEVRFVRVASDPPPRAEPAVPLAPSAQIVREGATARVILVSCAKQKTREPKPARDLYTSPRFRKARAYAEASGAQWFILSAAHGLVAPHDWLAPYDLYLGDTDTSYRSAWGEWVAERLELALGGLSGRLVEIHAGAEYVAPVRAALESRGATVELPLDGLRTGELLAWYGANDASTSEPWRFVGDIRPWIDAVGRIERSVPGADVASAALPASPGLYGWFVDERGAEDLSRGLGIPLSAGLVYVGQTGATKWPTGTRSNATLRGRIRGQHLRGRRSSSTLRRTFGVILDNALGRPLERDELTAWMSSHLRVATRATEDADSLGDLERQVVQQLDPPLNLDHTEPSPTRVRLRELRTTSPGDLH